MENPLYERQDRSEPVGIFLAHGVSLPHAETQPVRVAADVGSLPEQRCWHGLEYGPGDQAYLPQFPHLHIKDDNRSLPHKVLVRI